MKEFEQIYSEYFPRVYAFLHKLCRDSSLCEEMTQETFYRAFTGFSRYDGSCELFTWLAAIGKNVWFGYLRKNRIKTVELELAVYTEGGEEPSELLSKQCEASQVRDAVGRLPEKYRDVVILRIYAELSYADIAASLGISSGSAKVMFHRAKEILRKELFDK